MYILSYYYDTSADDIWCNYRPADQKSNAFAIVCGWLTFVAHNIEDVILFYIYMQTTGSMYGICF